MITRYPSCALALALALSSVPAAAGPLIAAARPATTPFLLAQGKKVPPGLAKKGGPPGQARKKGLGGGGYGKGGPPPWAPAHGYRYKTGDVYSVDSYVTPFGIDLGRCNRTEIGIAIGAVTGGVIAAKVADGDKQILAILGGVVLGAIVGGLIGKSMDDIDQACVGAALEHGRDGERVRWTSADGTRYAVIPRKTARSDDGRNCREYTTKSVIDGKRKSDFGTACRRSDGTWQLTN